MIKLSIKGKSEPQEKKEFKGILDLQQEEDGSITLTINDNDMPEYPWNILEIHPDGTYYRCTGLPHDIGLQIDNKDRIIESEESE